MPALDFTLMTDAGTPLALSSLRGRTVVLYFYPKDDTAGCTVESCEFRDMFPSFIGSDAVILGISPDDVASHQKFKAKYNLPFTLLVDENHALAEQLGIWVEKQFMGNRYMGVQRTTYIIGPDGAVQYVFEKVNPAGHAEEVMAFLRGGVLAAVAARDAFDSAIAATKETTASDVQKPAQKPAKKPAKKAVKKAAKKTVKKVAKKVAKKEAKTVAKQPVKKVARKPAKKAAKKPAKNRSKKPATKK
ncbi:MAG: peroxiredoxin [Gemmatimonadaceae bacterium]